MAKVKHVENQSCCKSILTWKFKEKSAKWHHLSITFCRISYFGQIIFYFWDKMDCILCAIELCIMFCTFFVLQIKNVISAGYSFVKYKLISFYKCSTWPSLFCQVPLFSDFKATRTILVDENSTLQQFICCWNEVF